MTVLGQLGYSRSSGAFDLGDHTQRLRVELNSREPDAGLRC